VRLSAFSVVDAYPEAESGGSDRYGDILALAETADASGLSALWVAEHHFQPGGVCPSPPVLLAACGARTRRLRLGVLVSVLPFHNPVSLAEEYALLDQVIGGRLNLGVGSGYIPSEFEGFGIAPESKRERFDRGLETLLAAFRGEPVRYDGERGAPVTVNVRPRQRPHPPLWIAVQRREAVPYVARRGASLALVPYATVDDLDELAAEIREFRGHLVSEGPRPSVSAAVHVYVGDAPDRARAALQRYLDSRLATQSAFYQAKVRADPRHASAAHIERAGWALFGRAPDVAARLDGFRRAGVDEVLGIFDFGGLPREDALGSVRALAAAWAPD
jgi:alkanesulfonate monooxygenase SsuD/methylene tetrahydromethanopterin reductase-like flavin-dependent oxidoreductase (luciferase family)